MTTPDARGGAGVAPGPSRGAGEDVPLVSFVVPAYNAEATLGRALASILSQADESVEVVVVNDGSTDGTARVAREAASADRRVAVIEQANLGVASARNAGMARVRGRWVAFVDADDELAEGAWPRLEALAAHEAAGLDLVFAMKEYVNAETGSRYTHRELADPGDPLVPVSVDAALKSLMTVGEPSLSGSCTRALYRRSWLADDALAFPKGVTMGEDLVFLTRCLLAGPRVACVGLLAYRVNESGASTTRRRIPRLPESVASMDEALAEAARRHPATRPLLADNRAAGVWALIDNDAKASYVAALKTSRRLFADAQVRSAVRAATGADAAYRRRFMLLKAGLAAPWAVAAALRLKRRREGF